MKLAKIFTHNDQALNQFAVTYGRDCLNSDEFNTMLNENMDIALGIIISPNTSEQDRGWMTRSLCKKMMIDCQNTDFATGKLSAATLILAKASDSLRSEEIGRELAQLILYLSSSNHIINQEAYKEECDNLIKGVLKYAFIPNEDQFPLFCINDAMLENKIFSVAAFNKLMKVKGTYGDSELEIASKTNSLAACAHLSPETINRIVSCIHSVSYLGGEVLIINNNDMDLDQSLLTSVSSNTALNRKQVDQIYAIAKVMSADSVNYYNGIFTNSKSIEVFRDKYKEDFTQFIANNVKLLKNPGLSTDELFDSYMLMPTKKRIAFAKSHLRFKAWEPGQIDSILMSKFSYSQYFTLLNELVTHKPEELSPGFLRIRDMNRLVTNPDSMSEQERYIVSAMSVMHVTSKHYLMNSHKPTEAIRLTEFINHVLTSKCFNAHDINPYLVLNEEPCSPVSYLIANRPSSEEHELRELITAATLRQKTDEMKSIELTQRTRPSL
ncbi:hypothetical protein ACEUAI_13280 [Aeromonas veronii]